MEDGNSPEPEKLLPEGYTACTECGSLIQKGKQFYGHYDECYRIELCGPCCSSYYGKLRDGPPTPPIRWIRKDIVLEARKFDVLRQVPADWAPKFDVPERHEIPDRFADNVERHC